MGVNLPAKNVIVLGVHRGTTLIDNMDIQQYIGRAGRPKYDKVGNAYVLYPESDEDDDLLEEIKGDINIKSVLNTFDNALFHIIKQIYLGNVYDYKTAVKFWEKTFSYALNGLSIDLQMVLDKLEELGMLKNNECNTIEIQKLGEIAAVFYFSPRDVNRWYNNLKGMIAEPSRWHNDYWLAYLVTSPLQVDAEAWISRKETNDVRAFADVFEKETRRSINPSWAKHTQRNYRILTDKDDSYALRTEVDRRLGSMATVARLYGWDIRKQLEATALRFEYGMGEEAVDLLKIYGIGRVRAGELLKRNIKNAKDIVDNKEIIIDIYKGNGEKIVAGAIKEMTTDDKPSRWYHVSQSIK
jgi:helicase